MTKSSSVAVVIYFRSIATGEAGKGRGGKGGERREGESLEYSSVLNVL
jgi:hypothetical protein